MVMAGAELGMETIRARYTPMVDGNGDIISNLSVRPLGANLSKFFFFSLSQL